MISCQLGSHCECQYKAPSTKLFCEHARSKGQPLGGELRMFKELPAPWQERCIVALQCYFSTQYLDSFREQVQRGIIPGTEWPRFHFDEGIKIRNRLRRELQDDLLPTRNWDDYYMGAMIAAVCERTPA